MLDMFCVARDAELVPNRALVDNDEADGLALPDLDLLDVVVPVPRLDPPVSARATAPA